MKKILKKIILAADRRKFDSGGIKGRIDLPLVDVPVSSLPVQSAYAEN